jgi:hypothetical protein
MARLVKSIHWVGVLLVVSVLEGYANRAMGAASQLAPGEESLVSGQKTVVFLRMKGFLENKLFDEVPLMSELDKNGFGITLKPQGKPAVPVSVQLHRIDAAKAGQKGWLYFVSDPGNYSLEFVQNQGSGQKILSPPFILRVPPQKSLVYAGSIHLYCKMQPGFWAPSLGECQDIRVTDEGTTALNMVKPLHGEVGPAFASILKKEGDRIPPVSSKNWFPMGLVTTGAKEMGSPPWVKRGIQRTTGLIGIVPPGQIAMAAVDGQWIGLAYLLYLPVGVSLGGASGKAAEKKWQPCLQRLGSEIQRLDPTKLLRQELQGEIKKYGPMPPIEFQTTRISSQELTRRNLRSFLEVKVTRILMRESYRERGSFSLEIAIRASLSEMPRNNVAYEAELVYTNPDPVIYTGGTPMNERAATLKISPCRNMATYCGPEGGRILQEDLSHGIHYLVERLLLELGFFSNADYKQHSPSAITPIKKTYPHRSMIYRNVKIIVEDEVNTDYSRGGATLLTNRLKSELGPLGYNSVEHGEDLTLIVTIKSFSPGDRAKRIFIGIGGAGKAELNYVAQVRNKSGYFLSQSFGGKKITAKDRGAMLNDEKMRDRLIQESVEQIGNFVKNYHD